MATYQSNLTTTSVPAIYAASLFGVVYTITVPSVGYANADQQNLFYIPGAGNNVDLLMFYISSPALDTSSPTATVEFGDTGSATRYTANTSTFPRGAVDAFANALNGFAAGSLPRTYTAADTVFFKFTAALNSAATSGTIKGHALMYAGALS